MVRASVSWTWLVPSHPSAPPLNSRPRWTSATSSGKRVVHPGLRRQARALEPGEDVLADAPLLDVLERGRLADLLLDAVELAD